MRALLLILLLAQAASAHPLWEQWKADRAFAQGRWQEAISGYQRALAEGDTPRLRYNLALAQARAGDVKSAQQGFEAVLQGDDLELRARAAYNLGNLLYGQDQLEPALEAYKKALRYDENDQDARHNAWVVIQKLKQKKQQQDQKKNQQNDQKDKKDEPQSGQDQKDKKDQKSGQKPDQKDDKSGGQEPRDQDGRGQQDPNQRPGGQDKKPGQKDDQAGPDQSGKQGQDQKDRASRPDPSREGPEAAAARARRQEAEQLLRFFAEKEKQETGERARAQGIRTIRPQGGQTW